MHLILQFCSYFEFFRIQFEALKIAESEIINRKTLNNGVRTELGIRLRVAAISSIGMKQLMRGLNIKYW